MKRNFIEHTLLYKGKKKKFNTCAESSMKSQIFGLMPLHSCLGPLIHQWLKSIHLCLTSDDFQSSKRHRKRNLSFQSLILTFFFFFLSLTFNHTPTRVLCHLTEGSFLIPDMNVLVEYTWLEAENLPNPRPAKSIPGLGTMKLTLQFQQLLPKLGDTRSFPQNTLKLNSKKRSSKLFQNPLKPSFETINLRTVSSFSTKSRPIIIKSEWTEDRKEELKSLLILTSWACFSNCNRSIPDKLPMNWISASVISKCGLPVQIHSSIVILVQLQTSV